MTMLVPQGEAEFSEDGLHRYWLTRELGGDRPLVSIGANPSTATAEVNDNTIRKEMKYTRSWGCSRLIKVNMCSYRATDPEAMYAAAERGIDVSGGDVNDTAILRAVGQAVAFTGIVLAGWGRIPEPERVRYVIAMIEKAYPIWWTSADERCGLKCIKANKDGSPIHPLYQKDDAVTQPWRLP